MSALFLGPRGLGFLFKRLTLGSGNGYPMPWSHGFISDRGCRLIAAVEHRHRDAADLSALTDLDTRRAVAAVRVELEYA
jgi:hypothetical protein